MNHEDLCKAIRHIAWGYILIHLHFRLGTLDLLPDFAGYLLFLGTLPHLGKTEPSALLLKPFCLFLVVWELANWILSIIGITDLGYLPGLLVTIISLYFHFQLLTNIAAIAKTYNCPEERSILLLRTIRTLMITFFALPLPWNEQSVLTVIIVLITLVVTFVLCAALFSLHKSLVACAPEESLETITENQSWDN